MTTPENIRILHVDDEPEVVELTAEMLYREDDRFTVQTATSPKEALDRIADYEFECIVSDYDMPGMDGITFLERVREEYGNLPFILFTGKGSEEVASEAISAGVTDYLQKDTGADQYTVLANRIANAVEQERAKQRLRERERDLERQNRRLSALFENFPESTFGYVYEDEEPHVAFVNEAFTDVFGYETEEAVGEHIDELIVPPDRHEEASQIDDRVRAGETLDEETRRQAHAGLRDFLFRNISLPEDDEIDGYAIYTDITDAKERERELERQRERYRTLFENAPIVVWEEDFSELTERLDELAAEVDDLEAHLEDDRETLLELADTVEINDVNEYAVEHYDAPSKEALIENLDKLVTEQTYEAYKEEFLALAAGETQITVETQAWTLDGELRDELLHVFVPGAEAGDYSHAYVTATDITERKRRQRELERQNELFAKTQDIANVGAWEYNPQTEEAYFTDEVYEIYGVGSDHEPNPEEDIQRFYHPEDRERLREAVRRALEFGEGYDIEVRLTDADGTDKWVRTRANPHLADGEVVKVRGTIRDITDRKEQERALTKEREFIEQSLDTLDDIFYLVDTNGDFERWNSTLPERTGYSDDEISAMNALEFFEGEHREAIQTSIRTILETGSHVTEAEITTADGQAIPHEFRGVRMTDDDGNPTGIIGIARDITERKEREERLIRQNEQLEEFVGVVSHDLRNPLNVAESRLALAAEECDSEHLSRAADAITRSQALIEDLLHLAREEEDVTEGEPLELADVAEDSWETVETGSATLNLDTTQVIHADRSRLQQLFENLYRNAVEHAGDGVTVHVGDIENGFYIADTGPGIPESDRDEIFEAGYSTAAAGTGFGLRIVEQIAEAHGWEIRVVDSADGGARFEITGVEILD